MDTDFIVERNVLYTGVENVSILDDGDHGNNRYSSRGPEGRLYELYDPDQEPEEIRID
jgi:hypothetical protein